MASENKTTIYTLSQELDVSPATISKALRGAVGISSEMRKKVHQLAKKKNFKPRVVTQKVPNLCVLIQQYPGHPLDFNLFLSSIFDGVAQYVREEGLEMSLFADDVSSLNRCDIIRELRRRAIDGAIVLRSNAQSDYLSALVAENFPHYTLLSAAMSHTPNTICVDNSEIGYRATKYLIDNGHRSIGVLVSPPNGDSGQNRFEGYRAALKEAGIPFNPSLVAYESADQTGLAFGLGGTRNLIAKNPEITALFAMDHAVAVGSLHCFYRHKILCPDEISLISCDDYAETGYLQPPLTVVDIPNSKLSYIAARQVHRLIRGLAPIGLNQARKMCGNIIERESVSAPRTGKLFQGIRA